MKETLNEKQNHHLYHLGDFTKNCEGEKALDLTQSGKIPRFTPSSVTLKANSEKDLVKDCGYSFSFIYLFNFARFSGREAATAQANYCGPVKTRPQHR